MAPASLKKISSALDAVHAVLNTVSRELLDQQIANSIAGGPEAQEFLCNARQLVDSVKFIDAIVDPGSTAEVTDTVVAIAFLRKLGLKPTAQQVDSVIELREAARTFSEAV